MNRKLSVGEFYCHSKRWKWIINKIVEKFNEHSLNAIEANNKNTILVDGKNLIKY